MTPSTCSAQKTQVDSKRENKDESNMFKENINDKPECAYIVQIDDLSTPECQEGVPSLRVAQKQTV